MKSDYTSSDYKLGRNMLACAALISSMLWACAVDSMSITNTIIYAIPCVVLWCVVKELNSKYESTKKEEEGK